MPGMPVWTRNHIKMSENKANDPATLARQQIEAEEQLKLAKPLQMPCYMSSMTKGAGGAVGAGLICVYKYGNFVCLRIIIFRLEFACCGKNCKMVNVWFSWSISNRLVCASILNLLIRPICWTQYVQKRERIRISTEQMNKIAIEQANKELQNENKPPTN